MLSSVYVKAAAELPLRWESSSSSEDYSSSKEEVEYTEVRSRAYSRTRLEVSYIY